MAGRRRFLPGLREKVAGATEQKSLLSTSGVMQPIVLGGAGSGMRYGWEDRAAGWDLEKAVAEGFEREVWVFRAIQAISGHASRLPFGIGRNMVDGEYQETLEDHPLLRVMNKRANPIETGRMFRKRLSAQFLLSKRGVFVEVTKSRAGRIARLDLLPPERVIPTPDPGGDYIAFFEFHERDGEVREIPPERIRWIRDPHPTDPFSSVTPLEAAGISVDMDILSRLFNVSFIRNDARPGGVLGIDADGIDDDEMKRIESRLLPGPENAGKIAAIGTGPGGMSYVDTAAKPRDMSYEHTSINAKNEILSAFGVPESIAGNASERTYANAEQEAFNFWAETMLPHLEMIASPFDPDIDDVWDPFIDTSSIEVLELPRRKRREEARQEFKDGLISIDEYRKDAKRDLYDNAHSRALWISPSKAPVPKEPSDAEALGILPTGGPGEGGPPAEGGMPGSGGQPPAPTEPDAGTAIDAVHEARGGDGTAADAVQEARGDVAGGTAADSVFAARGGTAAGSAESAVNAARAGVDTVGAPGAASAAVDAARTMETKAASPFVEYDPGEDEARRLEIACAAALDALLARQAGVVAAKLDSPKTRKGTRYWQPDSPTDTRGGDKPIDPGRVVDEDRWVQATSEALQPIVEPAAAEAGAGLLAALAAAGVLAGGAAAGAGLAGQAAQTSASTILSALTIAGEATRELLEELAKAIVAAQLVPIGLDELQAVVRQFYLARSRGFAESVATTVAQAVVNGARDAVAESLTPVPELGSDVDVVDDMVGIVRLWRTRGDENVRPAHQELAGQIRPIGEPFIVDDFPLRYPGDPLGPPSLVRHCRCWLAYRATATGRFVPAPPGEVRSERSRLAGAR
ncbi:phage portal protein [Actinopolymorpha sp. B17G11]|uniref:phage portal protein n=1 Tax=Actinopolymorpha sp. B17G11 TaxID=3160861 RepID=UPI0032E47892